MSTSGVKWLFVSDVDDTLVGDERALANLSTALEQSRSEVVLAYNSSRPCASVRRTLATTPYLPIPDYLVGALGTEIEDGLSGQRLAGYSRRLSASDWQRARVAAVVEAFHLTPHPDEFQTPFKVSYDVPHADVYREITSRLAEEGMKVTVIFSGGKNLDLIPQSAGKGNAIRYLHAILNIAHERVVVAGDSANDLDMFVSPFMGIVVGNAEPALRQLASENIYQADGRYAAGVLEGLRYWGVLENSKQ